MADWKEKLALTAQRNRQKIVKAKLDRREMMRLGLLTAGGTLPGLGDVGAPSLDFSNTSGLGRQTRPLSGTLAV
jgi:hypothetical protein